MKKKIKLLSVILCVVLCFAALPFTALAEGYIDNTATVEDRLDQSEYEIFNNDSSYRVHGNYVAGVACGTVCSDFIANFKVTVTVKSGDNEISGSTKIKTGDTVDIPEVGIIGIAVLGDLNYDGMNTVTDVINMRAGIMNNSFSNIQKAAADIDGENAVTVTDITKLLELIIK